MLGYRPPADQAFHVSEVHIILGCRGPLLEGFTRGLQDEDYDPASVEYVVSFIPSVVSGVVISCLV